MNKIFVLTVLFALFITTGYSQISDLDKKDYKHFIGIQGNPYSLIGQEISWDEMHAYTYALRYGYNINDNFCAGIELSGIQYSRYQYLYESFQSKSYQAGLFGRYTYCGFKCCKPFAEISTYYGYSTSWIQLTLEEPRRSVEESYFTGYVALGTSWRLFTDRLSLDVMYKLSPREFVNLRNHVMTYRINFHF